MTGCTANGKPIAHPYLWGLGAKSLLHPDLELIRSVLMEHASSSDSTHRRLWERSIPEDPTSCTLAVGVDECTHGNGNGLRNETHVVGHLSNGPQLRRRGLFMRETRQPDETTSILSPDVNLVVAIDWDLYPGFTPISWAQWAIQKLRSSLTDAGPRRSLQLSSDIIMVSGRKPVVCVNTRPSPTILYFWTPWLLYRLKSMLEI